MALRVAPGRVGAVGAMKSSAHARLPPSALGPDGHMGAQQGRGQSWVSDAFTHGVRVAWNPEVA